MSHAAGIFCLVESFPQLHKCRLRADAEVARKCESEIYSNIIRSLTVRGNALSRVRMNAIGASRYSSSESSFQRHFWEPATLRCWAVFVCAVGEKMCTRAHNPNLIKQTRAKKPEGCGFFECLSVCSVTEPMLAVSATIPWLITQSRSSCSSLGVRGRESHPKASGRALTALSALLEAPLPCSSAPWWTRRPRFNRVA